MNYVDHTRPPLIDISLPPAIVLPAATLIILYAVVLSIDFCLLYNERHLNKFITAKQLRIAMAIVHIIIPMIFISNHAPCNILFAAAPWFLASYSAHMSTEQLTIKKWMYTLFKVAIDDDEIMKNKTKIRCKGMSKISLGTLKLVFMQVFVNPLLPQHAEYALDYGWLHPMSLVYTVLFGIKAYCLLGAVDIFMGIEQTLFGWNMVDLFNSPIISLSPRDFWSRRWNKVVRNLLHKQVFTAQNITTSDVIPTTVKRNVEKSMKKKQAKIQGRIKKKTPRRTTQNTLVSAAPTADIELIEKQKKNVSFWSRRQGRGLLAFIISGIFHELIIMSACRRITLENLAFFTIQGLAVMIEAKLRQGALKQEPEGKTRILCIALQLLFMSITGRLFTAPFLRYDFFRTE